VVTASAQKAGILGFGLVVILLASGCASGSSDPGHVPKNEVVVKELPEGVTPQGVLLAAYLLVNGDISLAVEEALVSPEEVELARKAIADNTLQEWVDRASGETR
jgi:hypothetical protein